MDIRFFFKIMSSLISNEVGRGYLPSSWSWPEPSSFFPPPHHIQIKDNLLDGSPCPTRRSFLCLLMLMLVWISFPQPLQTNTWPKCCHIMCLLCIVNDLKSLSQTLQKWILSLSVYHGRLSPLQKEFSQGLQVYEDGKCRKLSPIKRFFFQKFIAEYALCWVFVHLYNVIVSLLIGRKSLVAGDPGEGDQW